MLGVWTKTCGSISEDVDGQDSSLKSQHFRLVHWSVSLNPPQDIPLQLPRSDILLLSTVNLPLSQKIQNSIGEPMIYSLSESSMVACMNVILI